MKKKTPRKKNKKMQFKKVTGNGTEPIDYFPEVDQCQSEAEIVADDKAREAKLFDINGKPLRWSRRWSVWFLDAMDDILSRKGLRVL